MDASARPHETRRRLQALVEVLAEDAAAELSSDRGDRGDDVGPQPADAVS